MTKRPQQGLKKILMLTGLTFLLPWTILSSNLHLLTTTAFQTTFTNNKSLNLAPSLQQPLPNLATIDDRWTTDTAYINTQLANVVDKSTLCFKVYQYLLDCWFPTSQQLPTLNDLLSNGPNTVALDPKTNMPIIGGYWTPTQVFEDLHAGLFQVTKPNSELTTNKFNTFFNLPTTRYPLLLAQFPFVASSAETLFNILFNTTNWSNNNLVSKFNLSNSDLSANDSKTAFLMIGSTLAMTDAVLSYYEAEIKQQNLTIINDLNCFNSLARNDPNNGTVNVPNQLNFDGYSFFSQILLYLASDADKYNTLNPNDAKMFDNFLTTTSQNTLVDWYGDWYKSSLNAPHKTALYTPIDNQYKVNNKITYRYTRTQCSLFLNWYPSNFALHSNSYQSDTIAKISDFVQFLNQIIVANQDDQVGLLATNQTNLTSQLQNGIWYDNTKANQLINTLTTTTIIDKNGLDQIQQQINSFLQTEAAYLNNDKTRLSNELDWADKGYLQHKDGRPLQFSKPDKIFIWSAPDHVQLAKIQAEINNYASEQRAIQAEYGAHDPSYYLMIILPVVFGLLALISIISLIYYYRHRRTQKILKEYHQEMLSKHD